MKKLWNTFFVFSAIFGAAFFIFPASSRAAFGISPPFLNADHLVKGAVYSQTIYLVQDQPNEDLPIQANLELPDPAHAWVSIDKGFNFPIPKGARQFPVVVTVRVPSDAGLGAYHGNISFTSVPAKTGQVTIALGVQAAINFTVGEGIFEKFSVPLIRLIDIEEGWNPKVYVKFNNEGNVPESFTAATYELSDQFNAVRLAYIQKTSGFPATPPFTINEYSIDFPVDFHLGLGQYWGIVSFYQNDKLIASQKTVFNVLKTGSLSTSADRILRFLKMKYGYFLGAVGIIILSIFIFRRKKRHNFSP